MSPIAGASIAAATHPLLEHRFQAQAAVVLSSGIDPAARIADLIELDPVVERIRRRVGADGTLDEVRARISIRPDARRRTIVVTARDRGPDQAVTLADAVVYQASILADQLQSVSRRTDLVIGNFERGLGLWGSTSAFSTPPARLELATAAARFGAGALRVTCMSGPGCGPAAEIPYPFRAGVTYGVSAWLRSFAGSRVAVAFGSSPADVTSRAAPRLTPKWRRVTLRWTPRSDASSAEVVFLSQAERASYAIDGVLMSDPSTSAAGRRGPVTGAEEARAMRLNANGAVIVPAEPTGTVTSSTGGWALGGAAGGLLLALAALGAGRLAHRQRTAS